MRRKFSKLFVASYAMGVAGTSAAVVTVSFFDHALAPAVAIMSAHLFAWAAMINASRQQVWDDAYRQAVVDLWHTVPAHDREQVRPRSHP